jgi:hypothetical protein
MMREPKLWPRRWGELQRSAHVGDDCDESFVCATYAEEMILLNSQRCGLEDANARDFFRGYVIVQFVYVS